MDTKKLRALLTAVDKGSLSAAAEELGYTQSGLTHMMNSLEEEFDTQLILRGKSGVQFSPSGRLLEGEIRAAVLAADRLERSVRELKERSAQSIRIGSYSSVARTWLPAILANYKDSSPDTGLSLSMQDISRQYEAVKNGELDCAIVSYQRALMPGLSWSFLRDDELVAVLPPSDPVEAACFPVSDFAGREFLMPSCGFDLDILPVFDSCGAPKPDFRYTNMEDPAIVSMVSHGLGVSIMSRLIMQGMSAPVRVLPLAPAASRRLGIIVLEKRKNEKPLRSFIETARSTLAALYPDSAL